LGARGCGARDRGARNLGPLRCRARSGDARDSGAPALSAGDRGVRGFDRRSLRPVAQDCFAALARWQFRPAHVVLVAGAVTRKRVHLGDKSATAG